jgi:hypothetical protein
MPRMNFKCDHIKINFCKMFNINPETGLKALRKINLDTQTVTNSLKQVFGQDLSCRIMQYLFDVNPLTYRQDIQLAEDAYR